RLRLPVPRVRRLAALDVATADEHAGRPAAAPAARGRGPARLLLPTDPAGPDRGGAVPERPSAVRPLAAAPRLLRRLRLAVVLRGLPPAVRLVDRLHRAAGACPPAGDARSGARDPASAHALP